MKKKAMVNKNGRSECFIIKEFFQKMTACLENIPDENKCQIMLEGICQVAEKLSNPIPASNFEIYWLDFKAKIKNYADEGDLHFYSEAIEENLKKILAPARAEL